MWYTLDMDTTYTDSKPKAEIIIEDRIGDSLCYAVVGPGNLLAFSDSVPADARNRITQIHREYAQIPLSTEYADKRLSLRHAMYRALCPDTYSKRGRRGVATLERETGGVIMSTAGVSYPPKQ